MTDEAAEAEADWRYCVDEAYADDEPSLPDLCQQFGCSEWAVTWCPLCRAYFCKQHDELTPVRRHDCLRGRAEV